MAWPWLAIVARNVPWIELVRRAPDILARSRELLEESKRPRARELHGGRATEAELARRIEALEGRDAEHARIIAEMVDQLAGLVDAVRVLTARNTLLAFVVVALILAEAATLFLVLRR